MHRSLLCQLPTVSCVRWCWKDKRRFKEAREAYNASFPELYTADTLACWEQQYRTIIDFLNGQAEPIVDLASGRGYLVERLLRELPNPIAATDFSPSILHKDRRRFEQLGLAQHLSLLAFDARRTPFRDGAVSFLTTNIGLANIEQPGSLFRELRRIVSGHLLAVNFFFAPEDAVHGEILRQFGLEKMLLREPFLELVCAAGWQAELVGHCTCTALPTPESELLPGFSPDGLPVAETTLEWATLHAS